MILIYNFGEEPRIKIARVYSVPVYLRNAVAQSPEKINVLLQLPDRAGLIDRLRAAFQAQALGGDWYKDSPEIRAFIAASALPRKEREHPRLSDEEAREIFRAAHAPGGESHGEIAARFGVSALTVGNVARGQTHRHLFQRIGADPGDPLGTYYVRELRKDAPRFRMSHGKRVARHGR